MEITPISSDPSSSNEPPSTTGPADTQPYIARPETRIEPSTSHHSAGITPTPQPYVSSAPAPVAPLPAQPTPPPAPTPRESYSPPSFTPSQSYDTSSEPVAVTVTPQPVVQVLSPRGVEYVFLTISLFTGASGLTSALIALVNGKASFSVLSFPAALLLVAMPVFAALFLRLKQAELLDPAAKLDASKRRSTQTIQITAFIVSFFTLIGFVSTIFAKMGGAYHGSIGKVFLDVLVVELVAGGILAYYWFDEHRSA